MRLDDFRRIDYKLDKAYGYIPDNTFAKQGDYNGVNLVVQITDGGVVQDQTGVQLILRWYHNQHKNSGEKYFEELDATQGIFKVNYPTQMLFEGTVTATIIIIENGAITPTRNFTFKVEKDPVNDNLVVAENDFSILQEALLELNRYQNQIDLIKQNLQEQADALLAKEKFEFDRLQLEYNPLLTGLQEQFDATMANLTVDSELISARTSTTTGESYATAGERLDDIEKRQVVKNLNTSERFIINLEIFDGNPRLVLEEVK